MSRRTNKQNRGKTMSKNPMAGQQQPNIDVSQLENIPCVNCTNPLWEPAVFMRKVPALLVGAPTDQIVPVQTFVCVSCGWPFDATMAALEAGDPDKTEETPNESGLIITSDI
jgi:hypothetical protein